MKSLSKNVKKSMKYCILYNHLPVSPAYLLYVLETSTQVKKKRNCESNRDEDAKTTRCNVRHGEMINYDLHDVAIQNLPKSYPNDIL